MAKTLDDVDVIDTTVQKTYRWIDEISEELGGVGRREATGICAPFCRRFATG